MPKMTSPTVFYVVWDELNGAEKDAVARDDVYAATDVAGAATLHAKYRFDPYDHVDSWPRLYLVRDLSTKKLYRVRVAMTSRPEFTPGKPEEI